MMPESKSLTVVEITRISEEWADSKVVTDLLGHIQHLNQVIVDQAGKQVEEGKGVHHV